MRLIDADELIRQVDENPQFAVWEAGVGTLVRLVDTIPTIDPESLRLHGRWEKVLTRENFTIYGCSRCGMYARAATNIKELKYCPYCGAKMEALKDEVD